jgi:hypothetical protein
MRISRELSPFHIVIHQKQLNNVEYLNYLDSITPTDSRCTCQIKYRVAMAKAAFSRMKTLFTRKLDLNLRKKLVKFYIWRLAFYGAEHWTFCKMDQKYLESLKFGPTEGWRSVGLIV